jgi:hypothetical protein
MPLCRGSYFAAVGRRGPRAGRARWQPVRAYNVRPLAEVKLTALGLREELDRCTGAYDDDHEDRAQLVEPARRRRAAAAGPAPAAGPGRVGLTGGMMALSGLAARQPAEHGLSLPAQPR